MSSMSHDDTPAAPAEIAQAATPAAEIVSAPAAPSGSSATALPRAKTTPVDAPAPVPFPRVDPATGVPRNFPPTIESEIAQFEHEYRRFVRGELPAERFRAYRLTFGVYTQRQPGVNMVRIRIPSGRLDSRQIEALGGFAVKYGHGVAHVSTRQAVQLHFVQPERVPELLREVAAVGLSTREACGNNVRNVTACPVSGRSAEESFDVTPYARAAARYLLRHPLSQHLSRKFKIAVSSCPEDCMSTAVHDVGLRGRARSTDGRLEPGFQVVIGGGLGAAHFLASELIEFARPEEILEILHAVVHLFADEGNRRNRNKARLKFVVDRLGIERVREEVAQIRCDLPPLAREESRLDTWIAPEDRALVAAHRRGERVRRPGARATAWDPLELASASRVYPGLERWAASAVRPHVDPGRAIVSVSIPLGDIEGPRLRDLATLVRRYGHDTACATIRQNLVLPEVDREDLGVLHRELDALGLANADAGTALDVVSCPGADSCGLAITASKKLGGAVREALADLAGTPAWEALAGITINLSGCPNSCGQHPAAQLGLQGAAKKVDGALVPHYQIYLGGDMRPESTALGEPLTRIPARRVPEAVRALLLTYAAERTPDGGFPEWARALPRERLEEILAPFTALAPEDLAAASRDWGNDEPFSTDAIQAKPSFPDPGEDRFAHVETELGLVQTFLARGQEADALALLYRAVYTMARVLLEPLGKQPESDRQAAGELRANVIDRGLGVEAWEAFFDHARRLRDRKVPDPAAIAAGLALARTALADARETYPRLGPAARNGEEPA